MQYTTPQSFRAHWKDAEEDMRIDADGKYVRYSINKVLVKKYFASKNSVVC